MLQCAQYVCNQLFINFLSTPVLAVVVFWRSKSCLAETQLHYYSTMDYLLQGSLFTRSNSNRINNNDNNNNKSNKIKPAVKHTSNNNSTKRGSMISEPSKIGGKENEEYSNHDVATRQKDQNTSNEYTYECNYDKSPTCV